MPLKVLHCINSLNDSDGGPARSVPALAAAQAASGADVRIRTSQPPTINTTPFANVKFVTDTDVSSNDGWQPDIIHDHGIWLRTNHAVARLARAANIPRVVSPRGMLEPWCLQHRRFRKQVAWRLYQRRDLMTATCLHATSHSEVKQFRKLGLNQPVISLPNGVSLPENLSFGDATRETGSDTDEREILFLSRIHRVKGLLNLVAAWKQEHRPGWRLRIVGADEDGHRSEVEAAVANAGLNDSIVVNEAVHSEEKWSLLSQADVVVLPSFSENFGIVVAEALCCGTPVITTRGTPWSGLTVRQCGWYVDADVSGIAQALRSALRTSRADLKQMGTRGQRWVRAEFAWKDIGAKMLDAYDEFVITATAGSRGTRDGFRRPA